MTANSRFEFYEVVVVDSTDPQKGSIHGERGVILGMAQNEYGGRGYAVHVFSQCVSWHVMEGELKSTGEFMKREDFYDGSSIRVEVDPKTGEGRIVD